MSLLSSSEHCQEFCRGLSLAIKGRGEMPVGIQQRSGPEVWVWKLCWISTGRGPGPASLGRPKVAKTGWEADRKAGIATRSPALPCMLPITLPVEETAGQLLWSCYQGRAWLQGHMVVITCPLQSITRPEISQSCWLQFPDYHLAILPETLLLPSIFLTNLWRKK